MKNKSFEEEIRKYLDSEEIVYCDNTDSYDEADFIIRNNGEDIFYLEVKEKRKPYNPSNWPDFTDEANLFILDDLTVRKCLAESPISGVAVRNNSLGLYYFFSIIDLALMPRRRLNREIRRNIKGLKGKWLVNFGNGVKSDSIKKLFSSIGEYLKGQDKILYTINECYGNYVDEEIRQGGIIRTPKYWEEDVSSTR